jgi:hypothetical protein
MPTWICPEDGTENPTAEKRCLVCRHPNLPRVVVLQSVATGKEAEFAEAIKFGQAVFTHRFADPDAKFAADVQFEISRDLDRVAWMVKPIPGTVNPTFYNGRPIAAGGAELSDGGTISIGKSKLKLQVRFKTN